MPNFVHQIFLVAYRLPVSHSIISQNPAPPVIVHIHLETLVRDSRGQILCEKSLLVITPDNTFLLTYPREDPYLLIFPQVIIGSIELDLLPVVVTDSFNYQKLVLLRRLED